MEFIMEFFNSDTNSWEPKTVYVDMESSSFYPEVTDLHEIYVPQGSIMRDTLFNVTVRYEIPFRFPEDTKKSVLEYVNRYFNYYSKYTPSDKEFYITRFEVSTPYVFLKWTLWPIKNYIAYLKDEITHMYKLL